MHQKPIKIINFPSSLETPPVIVTGNTAVKQTITPAEALIRAREDVLREMGQAAVELEQSGLDFVVGWIGDIPRLAIVPRQILPERLVHELLNYSRRINDAYQKHKQIYINYT